MTPSTTLALACLLGLGSGPTSPALAKEVVWIHELESNPDLIGQEIIVEGRFSAQIGRNLDQIALKKSKVEFRLSPDVDKKLPSGLHFVRLTGTLTKTGDKLVMRVSSLTKISTTDIDRYDEAARRIGAADYRRWDELAKRTQGLADFYDDAEIRALANESRLKSFRAREMSLASTQVDELLVLASQAEQFGLDEAEARRMRHKGLRWQFTLWDTGPSTADQWAALADQIAQLLPGANTPLKPEDAAVIGRYHLRPIEVYGTEVAGRDACDREFWIRVSARSIEVNLLANPPADLGRFAAELKRLLPDRPPVWRQLLRMAAETEARSLTALPASRMRQLAQVYRTDLDDPEQANVLFRQWLDLRRTKLGKRDAEGRYELARYYLSELKDDRTAARLLLEAVEILPDLSPAVDELKSLGYVKSDKGWTQADGLRAAASNTSPTPRGRLPQPGMVPEEVRQLLGDPRPEDIVRLGTAGQVIEQWAYKGLTDIYVTFRLTTSSPAKVTGVRTVSRK